MKQYRAFLLAVIFMSRAAAAEPAREAGITLASETGVPVETRRAEQLRTEPFAIYYNQAYPVFNTARGSVTVPGFFFTARGKSLGGGIRFDESVQRVPRDNPVLLYPAGFLLERGSMRVRRSVLALSLFYRIIFSEEAGLDAGAGLRREDLKSSMAFIAPGYQSGGTLRAFDSQESGRLYGPEGRLRFHVQTRLPEVEVVLGCYEVSGISVIRKNTYNQTQGSLLAAASGRSPVVVRRGCALAPQAVFTAGSVRIGVGFQLERAVVVTKNYSPVMLYLSGPAEASQIFTQTMQYGFIPYLLEKTYYARKITEDRRRIFTSISAGF